MTYLQHDLWDVDWVSRWAGTAYASSSELLRPRRRIGDMRLVVGAVEVYSIPTAILRVSIASFG